jgi:DNA-binding IclR family transcriptional regulator
VLYVEKATGTLSLIVRGVTVGSLREYHCTALGKALLAERDPARERTAPKGGFRRHTSTTIVDPRRLEEELHQVRADGVAFDLGESEPDIRCVAAPIRDESGKVVAAISVTVPSSRFPQRQLELVSAVKAAANEISRELVDSASGSWYDREPADRSA